MTTIDRQNLLTALQGVLQSNRSVEYRLDNIIVNACAVRGFILVNSYLERQGDTVYTGPFKGMRLSNDIMPPFLLSRYVGTYEHDLSDTIRSVAETGYETILNIGCAEGYYAVGLARLMPSAAVFAYDILPSAREKCHRLAAINGTNVTVGERFDIADFGRHADKRCLVFCDIEGAEFDLLRPDLAPALSAMDFVVEIHEKDPDRSVQTFISRFADSHDVTVIRPPRPYQGELPDWITRASELDIYLSCSSFREHQTPWVYLRSRQRLSP